MEKLKIGVLKVMMVDQVVRWLVTLVDGTTLKGAYLTWGREKLHVGHGKF